MKKNLSISAAVLVAFAFGFDLTESLESITETEVHTRSAGKQHHTGLPNALIGETSPYLLQHAQNPVEWYPWGPEALQLSRDTDRPIFLSIGYSSCYWCHVMEREVFTNPEIAKMMNRWFVNIKVDREERPDLDGIYMTATQVITQSGGWPNSVFLTPELKPFFAGTYFPPEDSFGQPGFPRVLTSVRNAWTSRREDVARQADQITAIIRQVQETVGSQTNPLELTIVDLAITSLLDRFDSRYGGFGTAPKFPPDTALDLLLAYYETKPDSSILNAVTRTLEAMASGGIRDHVGGGFHRYATDSEWLVPHFEKMLYNQALLAQVYAKSFAKTGNPVFAKTANDILRYVSRDMTGDHGGFYTALDAETDAVEGLYYLWHESEILELLPQDAERFFETFDLEPMPEENLGGVIYQKSPSTFVSEEAINTLLRARSKRKRPRLDDKVIAGWNGLMIAAFAECYTILGHKSYLTTAQRAWEHIRTRQSTNKGLLFRTFREGVAKGEAYQEDYAFVIRGLLSLHVATQDSQYLAEAVRLQNLADSLFWDDRGKAYFFTSGQEQLLVRHKDTRDSAIPSGNAEAVHNLLTLTELTEDETYQDRAGLILRGLTEKMKTSPTSHNRMILGALRYLQNRPSPFLYESQSVVKASSEGLKVENGLYRLTVEVTVDPGWHINANTPSDPALVPTELQVTVNSIKIRNVTYPPPKPFRPSFTSDIIDIFDGTTTIIAEIDAAEGRIKDSVVLTVQACNLTKCLIPSKIKLDPKIRGRYE